MNTPLGPVATRQITRLVEERQTALGKYQETDRALAQALATLVEVLHLPLDSKLGEENWQLVIVSDDPPKESAQ